MSDPIPIVNRMDLEILRLATELQLEKSRRIHEGECDKLLWELHRHQLQYIEMLRQMLDKLKTVRQEQQLSQALAQSATIATALDSNQQNFDTVLELVGQHLIDKPMDPGPADNTESNAIIQNLSQLQTDAKKFIANIESIQQSTNELAHSTVFSVTDRIQDTLQAREEL